MKAAVKVHSVMAGTFNLKHAGVIKFYLRTFLEEEQVLELIRNTGKYQGYVFVLTVMEPQMEQLRSTFEYLKEAGVDLVTDLDEEGE